jgi:hypothetical protein
MRNIQAFLALLAVLLVVLHVLIAAVTKADKLKLWIPVFVLAVLACVQAFPLK